MLGTFKESKDHVDEALDIIKQELRQHFGDNKFLEELIPTVSIEPKKIERTRDEFGSEAESKIGGNKLILKYYQYSHDPYQWTLYF